MDTISIPKVWLVVGDKVRDCYPIYYCEAGDNSGSLLIGTVDVSAYEVMCAACEAYNEQRNLEDQKGQK